jgi:dGTPase
MYSKNDFERFGDENESSLSSEDYRSPFWRDYARLLHSPSFRRLTGKTQLFPHNESDFFRNRLTHSLEVAQIAKSIAKRLNHINKLDIDEDLVSFAALAHDLGHPPFGHQGEEALDKCMINHGGFEGNAQTLRIITRIEKKLIDVDNLYGIISKADHRKGLNLTYRSIASIIKYDNIIPFSEKDRKKYHHNRNEKVKPVKGYYQSEADTVSKIKESLVDSGTSDFKSIECSIMDLADDIAYCNYDLEDSFKADFLSPIDLLYPNEILLENVVKSVNKRTNASLKADDISEILISIFGDILDSTEEISKLEINKKNKNAIIYFHVGNAYKSSKNIANNAAFRTQFTSRLIGRFIREVSIDLNKKNPILSKATIPKQIRTEIEVLKTLIYESQILSPKLKIAELRGKEIVQKIFDTLSAENGHQLLPDDYQAIYNLVDEKDKPRIICDFVAGMTNRYAISFYGRLTSENPETIFKPL